MIFIILKKENRKKAPDGRERESERDSDTHKHRGKEKLMTSDRGTETQTLMKTLKTTYNCLSDSTQHESLS